MTTQVARVERRFHQRGIDSAARRLPVSQPIEVRAVLAIDDELVPLRRRRDPSAIRVVANCLATFVVVLGIGLSAIALVPSFFGFRPVIVASGSMEPSLQVADVVLTKPLHGQQVPVGSIIDYRLVDAEHTTRIHRVVELTDAGYRTQGDANPSWDSDIVAPDRIEGVALYLVPFIGHPRVWLEQAAWGKVLVLACVLIASGVMARERWLYGEPRDMQSPLSSTGVLPQ